MDTNICRTCLHSGANVSIYAKHEDMLLSAKIMQCAGIEIAETDELPSYICSNCESELLITFQFINKCRAADAALRESLTTLLANEINIEEDLTTLNECSDDLPDLNDPDFISTEDIKPTFLSDIKPLVIKKEKCKRRKKRNSYDAKKVVYKAKCEECGLKVISNAALIIHQRIHTGEKPYVCDKCGKKFSRIANLQRHSDKPDCKYRKQYCRVIKHEKVGPLQCPECGLMVNSPSAMILHSRTHTGEKPFACSNCDKKFTTKGSLKTHMTNKHMDKREREKKFTCETCGKSFFSKSAIVVHIRRHTGERPYECPFCSTRFLQVSSLIRHKRTHTGDKPFSCSICGKHFSDKGFLRRHQSVHSDERRFKCHLCDKSMKSRNSLMTHLKLHSNVKHNVCSACGMAFTVKGNLKLHMLRKHSEKSGQCSVCMKVFSNLEAHMRKHTGEKPFVCSVCNRAFANKASLKNHVTFRHVHADKYKCPIEDCSKTFPIPSMLEFHLLKDHSNHTPYVCPHCARGFYRTCDLSKHMRVSHMNTPSKIKSPVE